MKRTAWLSDSIARRFALAIAAAAAVSVSLNLLADAVIGGPAFWPQTQTSLLDQVPTIVGRLDAAPPDRRETLARSDAAPAFTVEWIPAHSRPADTAARPMPVELIASEAPSVSGPAHPAVLIASLSDGSSAVFTPRLSALPTDRPAHWLVRGAILLFSIIAISLLGAARLARPIESFAAAARRFGTDPNARPMAPEGPAELRAAGDAFNAMQAQIQRLVEDQAALFAAISHDLRTPLTRMRLRGEFIEDPDQQARLFRDVDEMQTMVSAVLKFLRDNDADEATTSLDLAELLRSIVDDQADLGMEVAYTGPRHLGFSGRPVGLRRAFGNLVENAVRYGARPAIAIEPGDARITVTISDHGPGIPEWALERVFRPFERLEPSRNRHTGGMGLGLTSARAVFRAHGGDVTLTNAVGGGLCATVVLPVPDRDTPSVAH